MKHVAVLMGGWSAERPVSLQFRPRAARRRWRPRATASPASMSTAPSPTCSRGSSPTSPSTRCTGGSARTARSRACSKSCASPTPIPACSPRRWRCRRTSPRSCCAAGVPVAQGVVVDRREAARRHALPPPYVLKPVSEGSSFGVVIVKEGPRPPAAGSRARRLGLWRALLAEKFVAGQELTCAVMGDRVFDIIEIGRFPRRSTDMTQNTRKAVSIHVLPAKLKPNIYHKVQELTLRAHRALGCRGVSRADFRYDETTGEDGELVVSRGQHPAWDDRNVARARNGGLCRHVVR